MNKIFKPARRKSPRWQAVAGIIAWHEYKALLRLQAAWSHCAFCGHPFPPAGQEKVEIEIAAKMKQPFIPHPRPGGVCGRCYPGVIEIELRQSA